jgi:hypothetical protein
MVSNGQVHQQQMSNSQHDVNLRDRLGLIVPSSNGRMAPMGSANNGHSSGNQQQQVGQLARHHFAVANQPGRTQMRFGHQQNLYNSLDQVRHSSDDLRRDQHIIGQCP